MGRTCGLALLVLAAAFCAAPVMADSAAETEAIAAARTYVGRLKTGKVAEAVAECWDVDSFLSGSFGLMYLDQPASAREASQKAFIDFVACTFSLPQVAQGISTVEIKSATAKILTDSQTAVTLELAGADGFKSVTTMLLARTGANWRIVDSRQGSSPSMRAALPLMWTEEKRSPQDSIATVLNRVAEDLKRRAAASK